MSAPARVCIVTAGTPSTSPRMLKAADALAGAGYRVRVVTARQAGWVAAADEAALRRRRGRWHHTAVDCRPGAARATWLWSGVRRRAALGVVRAVRPERARLSWVARAYARLSPELVRAALAEPADFFYGGTTGALAAVAEAARRARVPFALDLEDFHSGERPPGEEGDLAHALARRIEAAVLPRARFLTAASPAIAAAYRGAYGVAATPVLNTFPLPRAAPAEPARAPGPLRLYWFSQTIGPGRGLEDVIRAVGAAGIPAELHLRGRPARGYPERLSALACRHAPSLALAFHDPAAPDAMVPLCAGFDVGLAVEPGFSLNNRLALSNKALTYPLAGLAIAVTDTPGQRPLARDLGTDALAFAPGDVDALAAGLARWAAQPAALSRAKAASWASARRRWHWEHPEDRGTLLELFRSALG